MTRLRRLAALCLVALACCALAGCDLTPSSLKTPNMTELSERLRPLFDKTKAVCFGLYMVDVPATAQVIYGPANVPFRMERLEGEAHRFDEWVAAEEEKFKEDERTPLGSGLNMYEKTLNGVRPDHKIVVGYENAAASSYKIVSFVKVGQDVYVQEARQVWVKHQQDVIDDMRKLNAIASIIRPRADDEIPDEAGSCIDGAFIPASPDFTDGSVPVGIRLAEFPDTHLSIRMYARDDYIGRDEDLDVRLEGGKREAEEMGKGALYARIKALRRGPRLIGQWEGKESLARMPSANGKPEYHHFIYIGLGKPNDVLNPKMDVQLDTGVKGNSAAAQGASLTDEEAVALWDRVTSTIRVRQTGTAVPKKTSDSSPPPSGPVRAATGQPCPVSGVWTCEDHGSVCRLHVRAGEIMPKGVFPGPRSLRQKLRGERPTYPLTVVWALVSSDTPNTGVGSPRE